MAQIDQILKAAMEQGASDVHFATDEPVRFRIDGDLIAINDARMNYQALQTLFFEILGDQERQKFQSENNLDKSYSVPGLANFRVNLFQTRNGISAVLRTIPSKIPTIEGLGLPDVLPTLAESGQGLILVTGPTGSGKSTTLAAMINYLNHNHPMHILTAEDPVEFVHPSVQSLVNQREIGQSCPSFADALKYALREDPDVILVGELRDLETIGLAMTAAETGHLVFGTLHTRGAAASIDRIIDSFPANQQAMIRAMLSESLVAVISQALLKKIGGGRVAAYEIMVVNHAISNLIREGKTFQIPSIIQTGKKDGMVLMDQHLKELVQKGLTSYDEAIVYCDNPQTLQGLQGRGNAANATKKVAQVKAQSVKAPAAPAPAPPPMRGGARPGGPPGAPPGAPPAGAVPPSMPGGTPPPAPPANSAPPSAPPAGSAPPPTQSEAPPPPPPAPSAPSGSGFSPAPLQLGEQTQAQFNLKQHQQQQNAGAPPVPPPPSQVGGAATPPGAPPVPAAGGTPPPNPAGAAIDLDEEVSRMDIELPDGEDKKAS